jgi:hypothetical protein
MSHAVNAAEVAAFRRFVLDRAAPSASVCPRTAGRDGHRRIDAMKFFSSDHRRRTPTHFFTSRDLVFAWSEAEY